MSKYVSNANTLLQRFLPIIIKRLSGSSFQSEEPRPSVIEKHPTDISLILSSNYDSKISKEISDFIESSYLGDIYMRISTMEDPISLSTRLRISYEFFNPYSSETPLDTLRISFNSRTLGREGKDYDVDNWIFVRNLRTMLQKANIVDYTPSTQCIRRRSVRSPVPRSPIPRGVCIQDWERDKNIHELDDLWMKFQAKDNFTHILEVDNTALSLIFTGKRHYNDDISYAQMALENTTKHLDKIAEDVVKAIEDWRQKAIDFSDAILQIWQRCYQESFEKSSYKNIDFDIADCI